MAKTFIPCSVSGCNRNAHYSAHGKRGWCATHYSRWRLHGDPLTLMRAPNGEPARYFREVVLAYDGDDCLLWPYAKSAAGYGVLDRDLAGNRNDCRIVSHLVCREEHGPPPTPEHDAAHSCGRGHDACVTKGHISWKTKAQNQADRVAHGTSNRGARQGLSKLTNEAVIAIRASTETQRVLAARYGVSNSNVALIQQRKTWAWLP